MKALLLGLVFIFSTPGLSATGGGSSMKRMNASDYTCQEFRAAIQQNGEIMVLFAGGILGRSFYANPHQCSFTDVPVSRHFRAKNGESCNLRWACEHDNRP